MILVRFPLSKVARSAGSPIPLLGSLFLLQAATGVNWSVYFAFGGFFLATKLSMSGPSVAVLLSSAFLVYCVLQFGVSLVLDIGVRLAGLRAMVVRSPVFYGLGMTLIVLGPNVASVIVGSALVGLGAATWPLMLAAVAARIPKSASSQVVSLLGVSYIVGQVAALGAGWLLVNRAHPEAVFGGLGLMWAIVSAILLVAFWPGTDLQHETLTASSALAVQLRTSFRALWRSMGDPNTRALKFVVLVAGVAPVLAGIYIPLFLIGLVGDPAQSASYIAASTAVGYVAGALTTPIVGAYIDRRRNASGTLLVVLVLLAAVALALSRTTDPLAVSVLAVGLTVGGQWANMLQSTIMLLQVPPGRATTFFAANQLPFYGGLPLGLGLGISAVGLTGSVANALLVVAAMFGLSTVVWWRHVRGLSRPSATAHQLS